MKTSFRTLLAVAAGGYLLSAAPTQAQTISNLDFETWSIRTRINSSVEAPTNWLTLDDILVDANPGLTSFTSTQTVTKSTDAHGGAYAAKIENKPYTPLRSGVARGELVLGSKINYTTDGYNASGVPYTGRPLRAQFYYKLTGPSAVADSAAVLITLTRNVGGATQEVAFSGYYLPAAATYTLFEFPLDYGGSSAVPDSIHMTFISGRSRRTPSTNTALYVDDISLGTPTATRNPDLAAAITVSPNPSPDGRYVLATSERALLAAPLTVLDATGRVVHREAVPSGAAAATRALDLSGLPVGLYTLQLFTPRGLVTRKLSR